MRMRSFEKPANGFSSLGHHDFWQNDENAMLGTACETVKGQEHGASRRILKDCRAPEPRPGPFSNRRGPGSPLPAFRISPPDGPGRTGVRAPPGSNGTGPDTATPPVPSRPSDTTSPPFLAASAP